VAVAAACAVAFFWFPDTDIRLLGIGNHRYFLFHSAIVPFVVWLAVRKRGWLLLALAAGAAAGVGVHLAMDLFQTKPVVFPWAKTLVYNTSVDDRLWEGGNAALCGALAAFSLRRGRRKAAGADPKRRAKA